MSSGVIFKEKKMAKNLVIVESPAKVKTIKKFLGSNYEVVASGGHVRDLPKSQMGIDIEHDFEPKYITIRGKGDVLSMLRKEVKKADKIYLATDPDREGEAISWHLMAALKLNEAKDKKVYRISFNEITKSAVKASLKEPREIDMNLVDAQQARRVLDRMVGYEISPVLWDKVKRGLSAGRVQSAALKIVCDREEEITSFIPEEYWTLDAAFPVDGYKTPLNAKFYGNGKKLDITDKVQLDAICAALKGAAYEVTDVKKGERVKKAPLPFTTSTLQQDAANVLNFATQKTMRIAQQLYEGVEVAGRGTIGLITYLRTDSVRISEEALASSRAYIMEHYGEAYASAETPSGKRDSKVQDAHEAIRPTDISLTPAQVKDSLSRDQFRLYQLIWQRFVACRMTNAVFETTTVKIGAAGYTFQASSSRRIFDGYQCVYDAGEEKKENNVAAAGVKAGMKLAEPHLVSAQHFTQPSPHYTEASLVRAMEEDGIGRPSTYAPTITTLLARRYLIKEEKNLYVTELGEVVNDIMKKAFTTIVDETFTANMESLLDGVEEGLVDWKTIVRNFYPDLDEAVKKAESELAEVKIADEVSDVPCDVCGRMMVIKYGPHGKFLACPGFPECKNTKPLLEKIGVACPKCGKDIVLRRTKKGRRYYGCESNGNGCDFMSWQKPSKTRCPVCGSYMVEKGNKLICADTGCGTVIDRQ